MGYEEHVHASCGCVLTRDVEDDQYPGDAITCPTHGETTVKRCCRWSW